jgi:uncharacterized protein YbjT (DUF2867 family)
MRVALIGATGLTGAELLRTVIEAPGVSAVHVLVRRAIEPPHAKVDVHLYDPGDPAAYARPLAGCDAVFVAVGTTLRKVRGDQAAYRRIDHDIPMYAARAAALAGVRSFGLVSSVGADAGSRSNFYLRLKGETEAEVCRHGIPMVMLARPSFLLGHRQEFRPAERLAQLALMPLLDRLLPKRMSRYHSIPARQVARALYSGALHLPEGRHVLEYDRLLELSRKV